MLRLFTAAAGPDLWPFPKAGSCCSLCYGRNWTELPLPTRRRGMLAGRRRWPFVLVHLGARLCPVVMEGHLLLCLSLLDAVPGHRPAAALLEPREKPLWLELGRIHSIHQMVPFQGSKNYLQGKVKSSTGVWLLGSGKKTRRKERKSFGKGQTLYFDIFCFEKKLGSGIQIIFTWNKCWTDCSVTEMINLHLCCNPKLSGLHTRLPSIYSRAHFIFPRSDFCKNKNSNSNLSGEMVSHWGIRMTWTFISGKLLHWILTESSYMNKIKGLHL